MRETLWLDPLLVHAQECSPYLPLPKELHPQWHLSMDMLDAEIAFPLEQVQQKAQEWVHNIANQSHYQAQTLIKRIDEVLMSPPIDLAISPLVVRTRGRPAGARNNSTRRDPSAFEAADDRNLSQQRRCGICRAFGHNRKTCPKQNSPESPLEVSEEDSQ
jgi:hypothetical protein